MNYGLVLEGGGMRGMFTAGVLDALLDWGITVDGVMGVSAGALFGINFISRQSGRALRYNLRYRHDPRYMGLLSWLTTGNYVNTRFAYERIPRDLDPLDFFRFQHSNTAFWAVTTDTYNGLPRYQPLHTLDHDEMRFLRASASMPIASREVDQSIIGRFLDGGLSDSIPLRAMQDRGYERNIVVLTQPADYYKRPARFLPLLARLFHPKRPAVARALAFRHLMYNEELHYIQQEAQAGRALLIYPDAPLRIGRLELSARKMRAIHRQGYDKADGMIRQIKQFLNENEHTGERFDQEH